MIAEAGRIEVAVRGQWQTVPALNVEGKSFILEGRWLRVARIYDEEWLPDPLQDPAACIGALTVNRIGGVRADVLTFAQKVSDPSPHFPYPVELDSVAAVPLRGVASWWASLPQETRKNARRAAKRGIDVAIRPLDDVLIRGIVAVNNDSPIRQGLPFSHYGKTESQVRKDQASFLDRSEFVCAYAGDELIGFTKLVYGGGIASILQLLTRHTHQDKRPANALLVRAVERCHELGFSHLVYGKYRYGNQPNTSLMEFKARHGFEEVMVPRYYVPLTVKGHVGMALSLHRDRTALLPQTVIRIGRRVRTTWYAVRPQPKAA